MLFSLHLGGLRVDTEIVGPFELNVLLSVWAIGMDGNQGAYGVEISDRIRDLTGREPSVGQLYSALDKLVRKGLVASHMGEPTQQRGGKRRKYFRITGSGQAVANASRRRIAALSQGLPEVVLSIRSLYMIPVVIGDTASQSQDQDDFIQRMDDRRGAVHAGMIGTPRVRSTPIGLPSEREVYTFVTRKGTRAVAEFENGTLVSVEDMEGAALRLVEFSSLFYGPEFVKAQRNARSHKDSSLTGLTLSEVSHSLLIFFHDLDTADAIIGDLEERALRIRARKSAMLTRIWYLWQVLGVVVRAVGEIASEKTLLGRLAASWIEKMSRG
ncbi:MAG: hypothetical protein GVY33_10245 [Alphaproteobacteria bacterium]|jgi:DNA-binding PadR family transcriptional regulator|nr:hypothetical protein [Alphaproteobacteria bacterium]